MSTDKIYYSMNGVDWQESRIEKTEVGEYTVYYKIVREGYAEYINVETLVITQVGITGVFAYDIICVLGKPITPNIVGLKADDKVKYSINDGEYKEQIELASAGEYTVAYKITRPNVGTSYGTFTLSLLPNISGTYIGNGERIILTETTIILNDEEYKITYETDGSGRVEIDGNAVVFLVRENTLTINENEYVKIEENSHIIELRINNVMFYAMSNDTAKVEITFIGQRATFKVNDVYAFDVGNFNYCESVLGGEEVKRDYSVGSIEFAVPSGFADITLSWRNYDAIEQIEDSVVLYDGMPHSIETDYENVLYLNNGEYIKQPITYTKVGEYDYVIVVLRDWFLPCVVESKLIILPDVSGVYVADGVGIIEIDGFNAKVNNSSVAFVHGLNGGRIGNEQAEYGDGTITIGDIEYVKTNESIIAFVVGDSVKVFNRDGDIELRLCEEADKTMVSIMCDSIDSEDFTCEIYGRIAAVRVDGAELFELVDGEDRIYYLPQIDMGDAPVVCVEFEME